MLSLSEFRFHAITSTVKTIVPRPQPIRPKYAIYITHLTNQNWSPSVQYYSCATPYKNNGSHPNTHNSKMPLEVLIITNMPFLTPFFSIWTNNKKNNQILKTRLHTLKFKVFFLSLWKFSRTFSLIFRENFWSGMLSVALSHSFSYFLVRFYLTPLKRKIQNFERNVWGRYENVSKRSKNGG